MTPETFAKIIRMYMSEPQASLLNGIIFGIQLTTSRDFYEALKMVGLLHIVVLSGINITLLSGVVSSFTSIFGKYVSCMITILTVILFTLFVGIQAPIIRAAFMGILTLVSISFGKRTFALYSLFLSIILTLIFWPQWIKTVSFQLSYAATFGLIIFGKKSHTSSKKSSNRINKLFSYISSEFQTSLAAQVFTAPIIFIYFKQVSLISPLSNILISFTIAPLMIFGFATAILGKIDYFLGLIPAYICYGILTYIVFIVKTFSNIPYAFISFK